MSNRYSNFKCLKTANESVLSIFKTGKKSSLFRKEEDKRKYNTRMQVLKEGEKKKCPVLS
jgi:hypothetical protein